MHLRPVVRTILAPLLVLALVVGLGWWASGRDADTRASLASALDALPAGTQVAGFTDWAAIKDDLGLGDGSSRSDRAALSDDASLLDLTTRSVIGQSIDEMNTRYGWSAADLGWEVYGQAAAGSAMVASLSPSTSVAVVEDGLRRVGYERSGDVWTITADGQRAVGTELGRTLRVVSVLARPRIVVAADAAPTVDAVRDVIRGDEPSMLAVRAVAEVATSLAGADTAVIQGSAFGCSATSFADEPEDVRAQAQAALARAGRLATPRFTGRGLVDGSPRQTIRFVAAFGSPAVAAEQARVRASLASGAFIGRTGRVEDSLDLRATSTQGSVAVLRFALDPDRGAYMTGDGPVLFASCPGG